MNSTADVSDKLAADLLSADLKTERIGREILVYRSITSTNDVAAEYAANSKNDGLAIFAENQTSGRARAGAKWYSQAYKNILCSILLTETGISNELVCLTSAVAAAEAIGNSGKALAKIKWPNDIVMNGKKIAGILIESKTVDQRKTCIIGIGINCHQRHFPDVIRKFATSIDLETGTFCDRISLAKRILISFDHWLKIAGRKSQAVTEKWQQLSTQLGRRIKVLYNGVPFSGCCIGADPENGLIVQLDSGGVRMFHAAHCSIIKPAF